MAPKKPAKAKGGAKASKRKATPPQRATVKLPQDPFDYFLSDTKISIAMVVRAYNGRKNCSRRELDQRCKDELWREKRNDIAKKSTDIFIEELAAQQAKFRAKTIAQLNYEHSLIVDELMKINCHMLYQKVVKHRQTGEIKDVSHLTGDMRKLQQNINECIGMHRLINNYPRQDPVKGESINGGLSEADDEILEAFKNAG